MDAGRIGPEPPFMMRPGHRGAAHDADGRLLRREGDPLRAVIALVERVVFLALAAMLQGRAARRRAA